MPTTAQRLLNQLPLISPFDSKHARFLAGRMSRRCAPLRKRWMQPVSNMQRCWRGRLLPSISSLNAAWQPIGPNQVASMAYGNVTGRVTAIAIDPADASGNTVYLGTTGGGVWKSTNAAGPAASVKFRSAYRHAACLQRECRSCRDSVAQHRCDQRAVRRCAGGHGRSERCLRFLLWQRDVAIGRWRR